MDDTPKQLRECAVLLESKGLEISPEMMRTAADEIIDLREIIHEYYENHNQSSDPTPCKCDTCKAARDGNVHAGSHAGFWKREAEAVGKRNRAHNERYN